MLGAIPLLETMIRSPITWGVLALIALAFSLSGKLSMPAATWFAWSAAGLALFGVWRAEIILKLDPVMRLLVVGSAAFGLAAGTLWLVRWMAPEVSKPTSAVAEQTASAPVNRSAKTPSELPPELALDDVSVGVALENSNSAAQELAERIVESEARKLSAEIQPALSHTLEVIQSALLEARLRPTPVRLPESTMFSLTQFNDQTRRIGNYWVIFTVPVGDRSEWRFTLDYGAVLTPEQMASRLGAHRFSYPRVSIKETPTGEPNGVFLGDVAFDRTDMSPKVTIRTVLSQTRSRFDSESNTLNRDDLLRRFIFELTRDLRIRQTTGESAQ